MGDGWWGVGGHPNNLFSRSCTIDDERTFPAIGGGASGATAPDGGDPLSPASTTQRGTACTHTVHRGIDTTQHTHTQELHTGAQFEKTAVTAWRTAAAAHLDQQSHRFNTHLLVKNVSSLHVCVAKTVNEFACPQTHLTEAPAPTTGCRGDAASSGVAELCHLMSLLWYGISSYTLY